MGNPIDDALELIGKGFKYILAGIVIIIIIISSMWAISQTAKMLYEEKDVIIDSVKKLCNYEDLVKAELTNALAISLESNNATWYALRLLEGQELSDCEWNEFLNHLNDAEKKKLKINDLVCDVVNCIP